MNRASKAAELRERKARQLSGLRRLAHERRGARARLLTMLRREGERCQRLHSYADESTAPMLFALGRLAMHYCTGSVQFEGVRFPVRRSPYGGAVLHPDTRDELVLFLW